MRRPIITISLIVVLLVLLSVSYVSASERAPGSPTLRWVTTSATTAELRADGLTDGGVPGNGAMTWDIYFRFPNNVAAPYPGISIQAGPSFVAQSPCGFTTNVSEGLPSEPGGAGDRGVIINGFCSSGIANNPVTGDNVLVATVTLDSCPSVPFVMDLDTGEAVFGAGVTQIVDTSGDPYVLTAQDLTDGTAMCGPTAVELTNVQADSASSTAQYGALLALALVAVLVAGAGFVLRRRNSAVGS